MTPELTIAVALPGVAAVIWFVRLEGRVNAHDAILKSVTEDLRYVRDRIDRALDGHSR